MVLDAEDDSSDVDLDELDVVGAEVGDPACPDLRKLENDAAG